MEHVPGAYVFLQLLKKHRYRTYALFFLVVSALWVQTDPSRASRASGASASASASAIFKGKSVLVQVLVLVLVRVSRASRYWCKC